MGRVSGTVVAVRDGRAWVECVADAGGCGACAAGRGCGWRGPGAAKQPLDVPPSLEGRPLEPGDPVLLEASDEALLRAAVRLYLPPLAGLMSGPLLLRWAGFETGALPVVAAAAGLVLGGLVARAWAAPCTNLVVVRRAGS